MTHDLEEFLRGMPLVQQDVDREGGIFLVDGVRMARFSHNVLWYF